jgi:predicted ATPase/DNA-binding SARP family transcriptional activator
VRPNLVVLVCLVASLGARRRSGSAVRSNLVHVCLLGPLELTGDDGPIALSTPKLRTLFAALALQPNDVVSEARLIDALWGEASPRTAEKTLQNHVLRLRRVLREGRSPVRIETQPGGYRLEVARRELDVLVAEAVIAEARAAALRGDHNAAVARYRRAESLWRGPSLDGFAAEPFAMAEAARLDELRRVVFEERVDEELAMGHHADLVGELEAAIVREPLRERRWGQLMVALYRSGRQADALRAYQRVRTTLSDELGLEPGTELRSLETAIITGDAALDVPAFSVHVAPLPSAFVPSAGQPFVGRKSELDHLEALFHEVVDSGARRLVVIAGEPGIGKSRLAAKLAVDARANGALVAYGRSDEGLEAPFQPFVEALEQLVAATDIDVLLASLGVRARRLTPLLPGLQADEPSSAEPSDDPAAARYELFDAIDAVLEFVSASAPVVFVLDDLHWADSTSLLLLRYLARSPRQARVLTVGTYRLTELGPSHPLTECLADLRSGGRVDTLVLPGLNDSEIAELLHAWRGEAAPRDFVAALHDQTDGNPFFVEEMMRHLTEDGAMTITGVIPEGVRDVIGRRLSRLSSAANETFRVAAVIGNEFDLRTLTHATGLSRDALLDALDDGVAAQLVTEVHGGFGAFAFTHALVRQTLYGELSAGRRAQIHWRVGQALTVVHSDDLYRRAVHLVDGVLAGDPVEAVDAALDAGNHARDVLAFEQAAEQYQRAIATLDWTALDDANRRYLAFEGLGKAYQSSRDQTVQRAALFEAADLARTHDWPDRLAEVATCFRFLDVTQHDDAVIQVIDEALAAMGSRDDSKVVRLLIARRDRSQVDGDLDLDAADAAAAMARRLGEPADLRYALSERAMALTQSPRLNELFDACAEAITASAGMGTTHEHAQATRALALACLRAADRAGFEEASKIARAEFEQCHEELSVYSVRAIDVLVAIADGRFDDATRLGRANAEGLSGYPSAALMTSAQLGIARLERGRHAEVIPLTERVLAEVPDQGYRTVLATAYHDVGRTDDARRIFDAFAADNWAAVPHGWTRAWPLRNLAELCARFGDRARAASFRPLVEPWTGQLWIASFGSTLEGAADRALGQLDTVLGQFDQAQREFQAALELERRFGGAALVARTLYWYARMLCARNEDGDRVEAARLLDEALEVTARLDMAMLHRQCAELYDVVA